MYLIYKIAFLNAFNLLILPHPNFTFDYKRHVTKFDHLFKDYQNNIDETDTERLEEVVAFHDMKRVPMGSDTLVELKKKV